MVAINPPTDVSDRAAVDPMTSRSFGRWAPCGSRRRGAHLHDHAGGDQSQPASPARAGHNRVRRRPGWCAGEVGPEVVPCLTTGTSTSSSPAAHEKGRAEVVTDADALRLVARAGGDRRGDDEPPGPARAGRRAHPVASPCELAAAGFAERPDSQLAIAGLGPSGAHGCGGSGSGRGRGTRHGRGVRGGRRPGCRRRPRRRSRYLAAARRHDLR